MTHHGHSDGQAPDQDGFLASRAGIALLGFIVIAGVLLLSEHRAHVMGAAFWLLLLACPILHIFMHGGHGSHGGGDRNSGPGRQSGAHQH